MATIHDIKKLDVRIDGFLGGELDQRIHEFLPEVIEKYFNKYDLENEAVLIDKIQFDLGSIPRRNFEEEFIIRLSYLLQAELEKFFNQPNLKASLTEKILLTEAKAFLTYLAKGYSQLDDQNLNWLFEQLLQTDPPLLREMVGNAVRQSEITPRLFYQVNYENLEKYWRQVNPSAFDQVHSVFKQILADVGESTSNENGPDTLTGFLRKVTFDFLMQPESHDDISHAFIEVLKEQVDKLRPFEHLLKVSAFQYLDSLSKKRSKRSQPHLQRSSSPPADETVIRNYILTGKLPRDTSLTVIFRIGKKLREAELKQIAGALTDGSNLEQPQFYRLFKILGPLQLQYFLSVLERSDKESIAKKAAEIRILRSVLKQLFLQDVFVTGADRLSEYLSVSSSLRLVDLLKGYMQHISVQKGLVYQEILEKLAIRTEKSVHRDVRNVNPAIDQLLSEREKEYLSPANRRKRAAAEAEKFLQGKSNAFLVDYIISGKTFEQVLPTSILEKAKKLNDQAVKQVISELMNGSKLGQTQFARLLDIFTPDQLVTVFKILSQRGAGRVASRTAGLLHLRVLVLQLFSEDIFILKAAKIGNYLFSSSSDNYLLPRLVDRYVASIAAKKAADRTKILRMLAEGGKKSRSKYSRPLMKAIDQIKPEEKGTEIAKDRRSKDPMTAFIFYLRSGAWILEGIAPQEILSKLLKESPEHLQMELSRNLTQETVWLRLIYQFPVDTTRAVFEIVFKEDDDLLLLLEKLGTLGDTDVNKLLYRKVLEAFFKAKMLRSEQKESAFSFEALFEKQLTDLSAEIKPVVKPGQGTGELFSYEDLDQQLTDSLLSSKSGEINVNESDRTVFIRTVTQHPHFLVRYLWDQRISANQWKRFLRTFRKNHITDLLDVLRALGPAELALQQVGLIGTPLEGKLYTLLNKSQLVELGVLLIRESEKVEEFLTDRLDDLEEKKPDAVKELKTVLPFAEPLSPRYFSLQNISLPADEFSKAIDQIESHFKSFSDVSVRITSREWQKLLLRDLPFAKSAKDLVSRFFHALISTHPQIENEVARVILPQKDSPLSFSFLVQSLIEQDTASVEPYFRHFQAFENYLLKALQKSDELWPVFAKSDPTELAAFLDRIDKKVIVFLQSFISRKYSRTSFEQCYQQILSYNPDLEEELLRFTISYGLTHSSFEEFGFLRFIQRFSSSLSIPDSFQIAGADFPSVNAVSDLYIEALVHYLEFDKHIYLPLEQDGAYAGLIKIATYRPEGFLSQLSLSTAIRQVAEKLFHLFPGEQQIRIFIHFFPSERRQVQVVLDKLLETHKVPQEKTLAAWAELNLTHKAVLDVRAVITYLVDVFGTDQKPGESPAEILPREVERLSDDLPGDFIRPESNESGITTFQVTAILEEISRYGKLPYWLHAKAISEFPLYFRMLIKKDPESIRKFFLLNLTTQQATIHFYKILGHKVFSESIKALEPGLHDEIKKYTKKLSVALRPLGQSDALTRLILTKYVSEHYRMQGAPSEAIIANILNEIPFHFGLSRADYYDLLHESRDKVIKSFLDTKGDAFRESIDPDFTYKVNLLLHLVTKKEVPWWAHATLAETDVFQPDKLIAALIKELLATNARLLFTSISAMPNSDRVADRIFTTLTNQQLDTLLLDLAPDFAGFMISLNLLVRRSKINYKKADWFLFIVRFAANTTVFDAARFLQKALPAFALLSGKRQGQIQEQFLAIAREGIKNGEMRFLPFIDLLGKAIAEPRNQPNLQEEIKRPNIAEPFGFIDAVIQYMRTGSLPFTSVPPIGDYARFISMIERQIQFGHNDLRLAVSKVLTEEKIRSRLIRNEKASFLKLIARVLYGREMVKVEALQVKLVDFLLEKWPNVSQKVLSEIFYQSLFEHANEKQTSLLTAAELIGSYLTKAEQVLKRPVTFTAADLKGYNLEDVLIRQLLGSEEAPKISEEATRRPPPKLAPLEVEEGLIIDHRILIKNAGLVITWPYLSRYFELLEMIEDGEFKTRDDAVRAVHLLQFIATGSTLVPEHELLLNKVLTGLRIAVPVPREVTLTDKEIQTSEMMLNGLIQNWERIKGSSIDAVREGFLIRDGYILETEKTWELKVEKKTLDILMEDMPWSFGTIKLPWMEKRLNVEWI